MKPAVRIGEHTVWVPCQACRRHVLTARVDGILTRADPGNLTITGELAARITGRLTFDIRIEGAPPRMRLLYRDIFRIRAARKYPVVAAHECGSDLTAFTEPVPDYAADVICEEFPDVPPF